MAKKSAQLGAMLRSIHLNIRSEVLDEFRLHLSSSLAESRKALQNTYESLNVEQFECEQDLESYQDILSDDFWQLDEVHNLGESLAIVGLYRLVESHLRGIVKVTFPLLGEKKKAKLIRGESSEIDCRSLAGFKAIDELRLINNSIKHNDSKANDELATAYPVWVKEKHMENLGAHYDRLKPDVIAYMKAFVTEAYAKTAEFESSTKPAKGFVRANS